MFQPRKRCAGAGVTGARRLRSIISSTSESARSTARSSTCSSSAACSRTSSTAPKRTSSYEAAAAVNLRATTTSGRQAHKTEGHHTPSSVAITLPTQGSPHPK